MRRRCSNMKIYQCQCDLSTLCMRMRAMAFTYLFFKWSKFPFILFLQKSWHFGKFFTFLSYEGPKYNRIVWVYAEQQFTGIIVEMTSCKRKNKFKYWIIYANVALNCKSFRNFFVLFLILTLFAVFLYFFTTNK